MLCQPAEIIVDETDVNQVKRNPNVCGGVASGEVLQELASSVIDAQRLAGRTLFHSALFHIEAPMGTGLAVLDRAFALLAHLTTSDASISLGYRNTSHGESSVAYLMALS